MNKRIVSLCLFVTLLTLVAGCWDQVQIEERGFVVGVTIDVPRSSETEKKANQEAPDKPKGKQRFLMTHQIVIPGGLISGSQGISGGQNTTDEAFLNLSSEGDSLFEVSRELSTRISRNPFYQHLKILVVSEEIARQASTFTDAVDILLRDPDSRRSSKVFISKGDARKVIEVRPKTEKIPSLYINSVGENINKNSRMLPEVTIGDVHQYLLNQYSFALPRIVAEKEEVKVAGSAIFSTKNKLIGFLGEEETEGLNFLTGHVKGGLLKAKYKDNLIVLNIHGAKKSVEADIRDKKRIKFTIKIQCEGTIFESYAKIDLLNAAIMQQLQAAFAKENERLCRDTIRKVHQDLKADAIGLGSHLKQNHYSLWKQIRDDWEQGQKLFEKSEIHVEANVYIRNIGGINK
ncbi:Ger(x)C family spore germination protein [uncultured Brevibacillus sp.]|uniref:Ger(x)C family spore germination protein n=1 Tax=uncultured Brevibacillus sp. TaxID=169970 RepID=UPI00259378C3|nr:Ger(x)C family spore germination protein [uncultured Brevibacillus sp.]